jgi:citrate synthase
MNHEQLLETESHWLTRIGKAFLTERVVMHGKDLHHELDHLEWLHLYLYCILGKDPGENVAKMLNSYWVGTSYPDPSIWPNHVAALAGSVRTTPSLGLMAGLSISEASIYGRRPEVRALDFFYRAGKWCDEGGMLEEFVDHEKSLGRILYGYGRPLATTDERIAFKVASSRSAVKVSFTMAGKKGTGKVRQSVPG